MKNWQDLKRFAEAENFVVISTNSGYHEKGSKHFCNLAIDVRTFDKTNEQIENFITKANSLGVIVRDERERPPNKKVWYYGAHLHLEL